MSPKILFLGAVLAAAGCQATKPATLAEPFGGGSEKLFAHRWTLTEADGQPVASTGDAREAHLLFFPQNRLSGSTGCNRLTGTFELTGGNRLKFSPLATTRMLCPGPAAEAETRFVQALGAVQTYNVTDAALELRDGTKVVARFRAAPGSPEK